MGTIHRFHLIAENQKKNINQNATKISTTQGSQESRKSREGNLQRRRQRSKGRRQEQQKKEGILCHLHLQGFEASPSRHWCLLQGHEHHELLRQRSFRTHRWRSFPIGPLQQPFHNHLPGNPNFSPSSSSRRVGKTCRVGRNQSRDQIHFFEVISPLLFHCIIECKLLFQFYVLSKFTMCIFE